MNRLKLAYFGTPAFSADFLEKLIINPSVNQLIEVKLVVTQPDRPFGRKQILVPSPVKQIAQKYGIELLKIENLKFNENWKLKIGSCSLVLIYFYGQIIPEEVLNIPKFGFWNIHFSALPKYRGPAPTTFSLIMGDRETAVSFVQTDKKIDHGDLITQQPVKINPQETRIELEERLHNLSFEMFKKLVNSLAVSMSNGLTREPVNKLILMPQNHNKATYTRFPTKNDGFIPLSILKKALTNQPLTKNEVPKIIKEYINKYNDIENCKMKIENSSKIIYNYFRGLYPWPGLWTLLRQGSAGQAQKRLKITDLEIIHDKLVIKKVQLEGKKEVNFKTFNTAYKIFK